MTDRLLLEELDDGSIRIGHQRSGTGFAETRAAPFAFGSPLDAAALEDLRWYLEDYLIAPYAVYEDRGQRIEKQLDAWGEALFAAVFGEDNAARRAYERAMEARGGAELTILGRSAAFLSLPWELLKDPERDDFLALCLGAVDRLAASPTAPAEIPPGRTLRVLMVVARPEGVRDVGFQMVARPLMERLDTVRGKVVLEVLRPPSFEALTRRLNDASGKRQPFHILHFDGHGTFGSSRTAGFGDTRFDAGPQGYLAFEKPTGGAELITADDFARVVTGAKVPVVVLNACRSGTLSQGGEVAAVEAAVATRLLHAGAASVVAMGYSVYAVAAAEFMAAFYETLFAGRSVSAAVAAGRARLKTQPERPSPKGRLPLRDWIVPVHYCRRTVVFPQLKKARARGAPSLDTMLDAHRSTGTAMPARDPLAPDRRFIGRDHAFYALELALRTSRIALLRGTAGTGKTELAKAFGRWWRDTSGVEQPELVLFHSFAPGAEGLGLDTVVTEIGLAAYGPDFVRKAKDAAERSAVVLRLLRERRLLLIWDNFESVRSMPDLISGATPLSAVESDNLHNFLHELRAPGGKSGVILTSRAQEEWLGDDVRRIEVGGLEPVEASELADDLLADLPAAREHREERSFAAMLDWLEGHPLSLRVLLPQLEHVSATTLLDALKGNAKKLPAGFVGEGRLRSLGASLKYSFDHLRYRDHDWIFVLALFEGVVDSNVLTEFSYSYGIPERFTHDFRLEWSDRLDNLSELGLVTSLKHGMFGLHPALPSYLMAEWRSRAGQLFAAERLSCEYALLSAYSTFAEWLQNQIQGGDAATAFDIIENQRRTIGRILSFALEQGRYADAQCLMEILDAFWNARGLRQEARGWFDRCRAVLSKHGLNEPSNLRSEAGALWLFVVGSEANWAMRAGQHDAAHRSLEAVRQRLEASADVQQTSHLAVCYYGLGRVSQLRGELVAAEMWYRRALVMFENLQDRPSVAKGYNQLGIVAQLRGNLAEAGACHRRALQIREMLDDQPGMAGSFHQLAIVAHLGDDLAEAETWYRRALEIREALRDRPGMFGSYYQLGVVAHALGNLAEGEERFRKALEIVEDLKDQPGIAATYHQLGIVAQDRKDMAGAEAWYRQALEIRKRLDDRPSMAASYGQLGLLAEAEGKVELALDWTVRCIALFPDFPNPATGPGPRHLLRLSKLLGVTALEQSWKRLLGAELPEAIRKAAATPHSLLDQND